MERAFTLIELLVVVLIIGILAAIAMPNYQKAVTKSKTLGLLPILRSIYDAEKRFFLVNDYYANDVKDLDVTLPDSFQVTTTDSQMIAACWTDGKSIIKIYMGGGLIQGGPFQNSNAHIFQLNPNPDVVNPIVCIGTTTKTREMCASISSNKLNENGWAVQ